MDDVLGEETASRSLGMTLLTIFAGLALLLATLGIYGVLAYFVVQHTQEIGVRMALGAQRGNILALVLKKGMTLDTAGRRHWVGHRVCVNAFDGESALWSRARAIR